MDFRLSEEQLAVQDMTRRFARERLLPGVRERDEQGADPAELREELLGMGFGGLLVPEEQGGMGMDRMCLALGLEELAAVDAALALQILTSNVWGCQALELFGDDEQKSAALPPLAGGESLSAFCCSEPEAGSDRSLIGLSAATSGNGGFILNGSKCNVIAAAAAGVMLVVAGGEEAGGVGERNDLSLLLVDAGSPGITVSPVRDTLGMRCAGIADVDFADLLAPPGALIGKAGAGARMLSELAPLASLGTAAVGLGMSVGAFELAREYASQREQFGRTIARFQGIRFKLSEMALRLEATRGLVMRSACAETETERAALGDMARLGAADTACFCARECVQIHGGYGYSREYHAERFMRDAKALDLFWETGEMVRSAIALRAIGS